MQMTGSFSECSWQDLFQLIGYMNWTCLLSIQINARMNHSYQIWFEGGLFVTATHFSRINNLCWTLQKQGFMTHSTATKILDRCPHNMNFGNYFHEQKVLTHSQIQQLFKIQILSLLDNLEGLTQENFELQTQVQLPLREMTGLHLSAYEALSFARQRNTWHCLLKG